MYKNLQLNSVVVLFFFAKVNRPKHEGKKDVVVQREKQSSLHKRIERRLTGVEHGFLFTGIAPVCCFEKELVVVTSRLVCLCSMCGVFRPLPI